MIIPPLPSNELQRVASLRALHILDTPAEERFDRITRLAKAMFAVPIVTVSLVDEQRQWFKSMEGLSMCETSRDVSFCGHAILSRELFIIPDALEDERFADNPLVTGEPGIRFYAGCPLYTLDGYALGAVCIIDHQPRILSDAEQQALKDVGAWVENEINTDTISQALHLLEGESRRQREALARSEELERLHEQLQIEHKALNKAHALLEELATRDPLTGLPNHRMVMSRIDEEISRCKRAEKSCALLFVDIDHFKRINDTWGHQAGDAVLREVSKRLVEAARLEDFVGRYGGEEFTLVLTDIGVEAAEGVAERLRALLAKEPCVWQAERGASTVSIPMTCSIGIAVYQEHGTTRESLIKVADRAMYSAKHHGRNRVCVGKQVDSYEEEMMPSSSQQRVADVLIAQSLHAAANAHDQETATHASRSVQLVKATARQLGCEEEEVQLAGLAALLHDVGKIGVPDHILHKPGSLTAEEWGVMRRHPVIGSQILAQAGGRFELVSHIVISHHERWDGRGYPYELKQECIPLGARILAVVDAYDAMTSDRPYREALPVAQALIELRHCAGSQFDPRVVEAFMNVLGEVECKEQLMQYV
jgi:diguanylate cyclase (GGDEF)-like protein